MCSTAFVAKTLLFLAVLQVSIRDIVMLATHQKDPMRANQNISKVKALLGDKVEIHRFQVSLWAGWSHCVPQRFQ